MKSVSLVQHPESSRLLARIKSTKSIRDKPHDWWFGLVAAAEKVTTYEDLPEEFLSVLRPILKRRNIDLSGPTEIEICPPTIADEAKDCRLCGGLAGPLERLALEHVESLLEKMHESADLYRCRECGALYLGIHFDAYDDMWSYWVETSAPEIAALREIESRSDQFWAAVDIVRGKDGHIISHPDRPVEKVDGRADVWAAGLAPW